MNNHIKFISFFILSLIITRVFAQDIDSTRCWVWVDNADFQIIQGEDKVRNKDFNKFLKENNIVSYKQALPFAKNPELLKIYEIESTNDIENIIHSVKSTYGSSFTKFSFFELSEKQVYDPADWQWQAHQNDWLWHLKNIKADLAWDISIGDENIITAVIDTDIDSKHPDLESELIYNYDPYTLIEFDCDPTSTHGTTVAGCVSAETAETGTLALGQMPSVGFNTKIIFYKSPVSRQAFLQRALHASNVEHADVIVSCANGSLWCYPDLSTGEDLIVREILDNGTVIVMAAGNGWPSTHCDNGSYFTPFYPFHPDYDERIIVVTSNTKDDTHQFIDNGTDKTHSHFSEVDICAPGYEIMGLMPTDCGVNTWPYYGSCSGTSFSSPVVAGACALLKSINPDLGPGEIQAIIKATADPIIDESSYSGELGAGRLNLFAAAIEANDCTPTNISSNVTWNSDKEIFCDVIIENGGILNINSTILLGEDVKIIVRNGGKLYLNNAILTTLDNKLWQGIYVEGDPNATSIPANQGVLEMNGATIENAICAITMGEAPSPTPDDGISTGKGGAIVWCEESHFINNKRSVKFTPSSYSNASYFKLSEFDINDDYRYAAAGNEYPDEFVFLTGISGVDFKACDFTEANAFLNQNNNFKAAINAFNSGFTVEGVCNNPYVDPCDDYTNSTFNLPTMDHAISASYTNRNNRNIFIRNTDFQTFDKPAVNILYAGGNISKLNINACNFNAMNRGIYISGSTNSSITSNGFNYNSNAPSTGSYSGLYMDGCTGYHIEDNDFNAPFSQGATFGCIINNSGSDYNEVYRNRFLGLTEAIGAYGENKNDTDENDGLCLVCNTFTSCVTDIYVSGPPYEGIREVQSANKTIPTSGDYISAANKFYTSSTPNVWNINNEGEDIVYYWKEQIEEPQNINSNGVTKVQTTEPNNCPSKLNVLPDDDVKHAEIMTINDMVSTMQEVNQQRIQNSSGYKAPLILPTLTSKKEEQAEGLGSASSIEVLPNPNNGIFSVQLPYAGGMLTIYNSVGEQIYQQNCSTKQIDLELTNLLNGIYILHYTGEQGECSEKVSISK